MKQEDQLFKIPDSIIIKELKKEIELLKDENKHYKVELEKLKTKRVMANTIVSQKNYIKKLERKLKKL